MRSKDLANILAEQIRRAGLREPEREYRFHPTRRWRFDLAWPDENMLAVECEGGIWVNGRHSRGAGFINDCEKYAEATLLGWRIYRIPSPWITRDDGKKAIRLIRRALNETHCGHPASVIVSADEGTAYCARCEEESHEKT
ncbi:MAG: hypothetical protein ABIG63_16195 [Chloroflexota bacterium]